MTAASKIIKLQSKSNLQIQKQARALLLRDFIHDRLYKPGGYFTQNQHQVGRLSEPIKFSKLRGYYDFRQEMERVYPENAWVTPCELFKPYYGYTIANFMFNQMENMKQKRLRVIEIGPGTGTFADSMLDFFKNYNLDIYRDCEYIFVEISPQLAEKCEELMRQNHKQLMDSNKIKIFNGSILDFNKKIHNQHCFVVGLEILDNLPHDRLYFNEEGKIHKQTAIKISYDQGGNEILEDYQEEIKDQLCKEFVELWNSMPSQDHITASKIIKQEGIFKRLQNMFRLAKYKESLINNIFAPTGAIKVIKHINEYINYHSLILADFDSFIMPNNSIKGINAPLVTTKLKDPTQWKTYDNYLIQRGQGDICFPVDFFFLKHAYQKITGNQANVYKTGEFVDLFAMQSWAATQNLYNPMREEYFNTAFLVTERNQQF